MSNVSLSTQCSKTKSGMSDFANAISCVTTGSGPVPSAKDAAESGKTGDSYCWLFCMTSYNRSLFLSD